MISSERKQELEFKLLRIVNSSGDSSYCEYPLFEHDPPLIDMLRFLWKSFIDLDEMKVKKGFLLLYANQFIRDIRASVPSFSDDELLSFALESYQDATDDLCLDSLREADTFEAYVQDIIQSNNDLQDIQLREELQSAWRELQPRIATLSINLVSSIRDVYSEYMFWLKKHPEAIDRIAWEAFEKIIAEVLSSKGFSIDLTGRLRNQSADLLAIRTDELGVETRYLIECKRYVRTRRVGIDVVNAVIGAARRANVDHAILVTSSNFTRDVVREENRLRDCRLHLRDGNDVVQWLNDYT